MHLRVTDLSPGVQQGWPRGLVPGLGLSRLTGA